MTYEHEDVELLPADDGARPWLQEKEVPILDPSYVRIGTARVRPQDGALVASIVLNDDVFRAVVLSDHPVQYSVTGNVTRFHMVGDSKHVDEVDLLAVLATGWPSLPKEGS